jgi:hypothetical protein
MHDAYKARDLMKNCNNSIDFVVNRSPIEMFKMNNMASV